MKKLFGMMALLLACFTVASCGDDNDEPTFVTPSGMYSALSDGSVDYENATETYYKFELGDGVAPADSYLYMYNIKFDENMPVTITMRLNLAGATITKTSSGYTVTLNEETVAELYRGGVYTPYTRTPFTMVNLELNLVKKTYSLTYACNYSGNVITLSDSGNLYTSN